MSDPFKQFLVNNTWDNAGYQSWVHTRHHQKLELNHVRLLRIKAPDRCDEISCYLETFELHKAPAYIAVSYAWGYGWPDCRIMLNDHPFAIKRNIHRFLEQVSAHGDFSGTFFWIDAICINQEDLEERAAQVQRMAEIFSTAQRVLVWLGPAYQRSNLAIRYLAEKSHENAKHQHRMWGANTGQAISYLSAGDNTGHGARGCYRS